MNNWLITGGCGFIGAALTRKLRAQGENVKIVDNLATGDLSGLPEVACVVEPESTRDVRVGQWSGMDVIVADIRASDIAVVAAKGADVVVHLAANTGVIPSIEDPLLDRTVNVDGTFNYLDAARHRNVQRFVFASSGAVLGPQTPPLHENLPSRPISPYGASKLAGEAYCSAYYGAYGLKTVALRFGNVYGPGSHHKNSVVAKFIKQALAGKTLAVYGDGNQTRDFIYIEDIVDAIYRAATVPGLGGDVFQIATQREHTVLEVLALIRAELKQARGIDIRATHEPERAGEVRRNFSDVSHAKAKLGFAPAVELPEGIRLTVKSFLSN